MRLQAADTQCPGCVQLFVSEAQYRCAACDGPVCQETTNARAGNVEG